MLISGLLAGTLCVSVGYLVVAHGLRTTRLQLEERRITERALVTDCLANVDRVIEGPSITTADVVFDLRPYKELDLDHVIDLRNVAPRHATVPSIAPRPAANAEPVTHEPSIWRVPAASAPRSAIASA